MKKKSTKNKRGNNNSFATSKWTIRFFVFFFLLEDVNYYFDISFEMIW